MTSSATPHLSQNEWAAVAVALNDARDCGCATAPYPEEPGIVRRAIGFLFGLRTRTPLADPRLEAIRTFVCASYRRRQPALELARPLEDHGFNIAQIKAMGQLSR
jgi:hypothetical protein